MSANPSDTSTPGGALRPGGPWVRAFSIGWRLILFSAIWVVLAGDDPSSAIIGVPAVLAATWACWRLGGHQGSRLSPWGALRFAPYFVYESIRGGLDVAARVLGPRVRVDPGFHNYRLNLSSTGARVFFVDLVSLLPGTLSADLRGDVVTIHALDRGADIAGDLSLLERRVGALFAEPVATPAASTRTAEASTRD